MGCLRLFNHEKTNNKLFVSNSKNAKTSAFSGEIYPKNENFFGAVSYGFNGMEKDNEILGSGNAYTAEFWQYDSRLGRRWNVDPKSAQAANWSSYRAFFNNPLRYIDPDGNYEIEVSISKKEKRAINKANKGEDKKDARALATQQLIEQKKEAVRNIISTAKSMVDSDEKVKKAFSEFTGLVENSQGWKDTFEENGQGPKIKAGDLDGDGKYTPGNTPGIEMGNGEFYLNTNGKEAAKTYLHETVHLRDDVIGRQFEGTLDGVPGISISSEDQINGTSYFINRSYLKYEKGSSESTDAWNATFDQYASPNSPYQIADWNKSLGRFVAFRVELGYAFEYAAFGEK